MTIFTTIRELNVSIEEIQTQETPRVVGEFWVFEDGKCISVFEYVGIEERRFALRNAMQTFIGCL